MKKHLIIFLLSISLSFTGIADLRTAIEKTKRAMSQQAYSYTANVYMDGGHFRFDKIIKGGDRISIFYFMQNGQKTEILRIFEKGSFWYLKESPDKKYTKYRPFEAFTKFPNYYLFNSYSELFFTVKRDLKGKEGQKTFTFFMPLDERSKRSSQAFVTKLEPMKDDPRFSKSYKTMKELLEKGYKQTVDLSTGLILAQSNMKYQIEVQDFKWLGKDYEITEKVGELKEDLSAALDYKNLILIRHAPMWNPKLGRKVEGMAALLNLKTLKKVRVPFEGSASMPHSFSPDKKTVYMSGLNHVGGMAIYSVNLETGENFQHTEAYIGKNDLFPKTSPDGKKLIYIEMDPQRGILSSQINMINLEANTLHTLVKNERITGSLDWSYDSKGFFYQRGIDTGIICYVDTSGKLTELIPNGKSPNVIGENELLFKLDGKFMTADYKGKNIKPFPLDFSQYFWFKSNSKNETLLMMKKDKELGPRPCIWKKGDKKPRVITNEPGLWSIPAF